MEDELEEIEVALRRYGRKEVATDALRALLETVQCARLRHRLGQIEEDTLQVRMRAKKRSQQ